MSEYNWREFWQDKTVGGYLVVAVYPQPHGEFFGVFTTGARWHTARRLSRNGTDIDAYPEYDLVPVVKEPEWEPWELHELPLDLWYRPRGTMGWERIAEIMAYDKHAPVRFTGDDSQWFGLSAIWEDWECTTDPRVSNPVVQRCGKVKGGTNA